MSDSRPFIAKTIYDAIGALQGGANSGVAPLLLEKSQASYLNNITVRDGFPTPRPPYSRTHLTIAWPSPAVQTAVEQGLYQGATYYKPDSGPESLIAQIGGFLYQFTIVGNVVTVRDISIPGDPNPATATQAWLWQAENFVIVQDGQSLPIFFDGATSRRSQGVTQLVGTIVAPLVAVPAIGSQATVNLSAPYTGLFNVNVLICGNTYQTIQNGGGYLVDATSLYDIPGTPIATGTDVTAKPSIAFVVATTLSPSGSYFPATTQTINITAPFTGALFSQIILFGKVWQVTSIGANSVNVQSTDSGTYSPLLAGTQVQYSGGTAPNVVYGQVTTPAVAPAIGATVQLLLSNVYAGAPGQIVYIGAVGQYKITAVPSAPGGSTLTLINVDAPTGGNIECVADGNSIMSVPELPAGRMGAYGHAQNWVSLVDGISFLPSDISGAPSGTAAYQYRDAVLKTTNITFGGGNFRIPSAGDIITSMTFAAILDVALGQGPLMVGTARSIFSCVAPINPSNVAAIIAKGSPILTEALKGRGPLAQNSTINVNSDIQFRSTVGLGSLILARQQFTSSISGNTPISEEMIRVFKKDNQQLLPYGSAINFDNRVLFTASPQASSQGVFHSSLVAMNLDGLSSLRGKEPAVYDGQWTGLNVLQLTQGLFNGTSRAFAFTFNVTQSKIELYELFPTATDFRNALDELTLANYYDNGTTPITAIIESPTLFGQDVKPNEVFLQLLNGEIALDSIVGTVRVQAFYKPDQFGAYGEESCWIPWTDFTVCAKAGSKPLYYPRLGFGEPKSDLCIPQIDANARFGRTFQVRLILTGMWRMLSMRVAAVTQPIPQFQPPQCNVQITT